MKKQFLEIGEVLKTHGLNGALKVQHWCDSSIVYKNFKWVFLDSEGRSKNKIKVLSLSNDFVILKFDGVNSIEQALKFVGKVLFANRSDFKLPKNKNFIQDLIGTFIVDHLNSSLCYGKIIDVLNYGASDIYKIKNDYGKEFLIPAIDEIIIKKDLNKSLIFIKPMEGLFDV